MLHDAAYPLLSVPVASGYLKMFIGFGDLMALGTTTCTAASMKSLIWEIGGERTSEITTVAWPSNSAMENEGTRRDDALVRYIAKYIRKQPDEPGA